MNIFNNTSALRASTVMVGAMLVMGALLGLIACDEAAGGSGATVDRCSVKQDTTADTYTLEALSDSGSALTFTMAKVPVGNGLNFFTGVSDNGDATVDKAYSIGQTVLTYGVWKRVYDWATASERGSTRYAFDNTGRDGDTAGRGVHHPVTFINWYDSIKFANALTEFCAEIGMRPVYRNDGVIMRRGTTDPTPDTNANGFRLLSSDEWELAARYRADSNRDGDIKDSNEYYPGNYASGASANVNNASATGAVAWYNANSSSRTHAVRGKSANALGLYDMSGNVYECAYDFLIDALNRPVRTVRSGGWNRDSSFMRIGFVSSSNPNDEINTGGLRLAR